MVILPFAVADVHALALMTIAPQTDQAVRLDALNVTSHLAHAFGWVMFCNDYFFLASFLLTFLVAPADM